MVSRVWQHFTTPFLRSPSLIVDTILEHLF
nr:MAG TPA: hypothetical protein [Caudoviricetes sp.]